MIVKKSTILRLLVSALLVSVTGSLLASSSSFLEKLKKRKQEQESLAEKSATTPNPADAHLEGSSPEDPPVPADETPDAPASSEPTKVSSVPETAESDTSTPAETTNPTDSTSTATPAAPVSVPVLTPATPTTSATVSSTTATASATTSDNDDVKSTIDVENIAQVDRDWSQDSHERNRLRQSADEYYQKILALEQKSNDEFTQRSDAYANLSQELNKVYNQASGTMGRFVEVGRKIEGYVQQNMARYAKKD